MTRSRNSGDMVRRRVVEVGHEVATVGLVRWMACSRAASSQPLVRRDAHGDEPGARLSQRIEGVRIARALDECAVAAGKQGAGEKGDRVLGADRDHDLFGIRRQTARGVAIGDAPGAARRIPIGSKPTPDQVGGQFFDRARGGLRERAESPAASPC